MKAIFQSLRLSIIILVVVSCKSSDPEPFALIKNLDYRLKEKHIITELGTQTKEVISNYTYGSDGKLIEISNFNVAGNTCLFSYDKSGRIASRKVIGATSETVLYFVVYAYNEKSQLIKSTINSLDNTITYNFDYINGKLYTIDKLYQNKSYLNEYRRFVWEGDNIKYTEFLEANTKAVFLKYKHVYDNKINVLALSETIGESGTIVCPNNIIENEIVEDKNNIFPIKLEIIRYTYNANGYPSTIEGSFKGKFSFVYEKKP